MAVDRELLKAISSIEDLDELNNFFEDISNNNDNFCIKIRLSIENKFKGSGLINKIVDYFYIKFIVLKELKLIKKKSKNT